MIVRPPTSFRPDLFPEDKPEPPTPRWSVALLIAIIVLLAATWEFLAQ